MKETCLKAPGQTISHGKYEGFSLLDLVELVADRGDLEALTEFHERRCVFSDDGAEWMRVTDYVTLLLDRALQSRNGVYRIADGVIERAYDLTMEKLHNLPRLIPERVIESEACRQELEQGRTDCRHYFRAFLSFARNRIRREKGMSALETDHAAARLLRNFVWRQFNFSLKEALRNANPLISRYYWKVGGRKICLWFPRRMLGRERRTWLEANVDIGGFTGAPDRNEIQKMIDQRLDMGSILSTDEPAGELALQQEETRIGPELPLVGTPLAQLDQFVAQEKADSISRQRRAIQRLGAENLKALILKIFDDLRKGRYNDGEIAAQFGLSKATFSRFAGSRWRRGSERTVPDLWANTAEVIARYEPFAEAAVEAGFSKQVRAAQASEPGRA